MRRNKLATILLVLLTLSITFSQFNVNSNNTPTKYFKKQTEKIQITILVGPGTPYIKEDTSSLNNITSNLYWVKVNYISEIKAYADISQTDILFILGHRNYSDISDFLLQFIVEGGSLLLAPPPDNIEEFDNFTSSFGVKINPDFVEDNSSYVYENTTLKITNSWETKSPIFKGIDTIVMPDTHSIELANSTINMELVKYPLIWGMNTTTYNGKNGSDILLSAGIELASGGKIVIMGSYRMFLNKFIDHGDNAVLAINLITWLANKVNALEIKNVNVSSTKVIVNAPNPIVKVNFTVTDQQDNPVEVNATVIIIRRSSPNPLIKVNATYLGEGLYSAELDFTGQKSSTVELWIVAHKKYYGYFIWPNPENEPYEIVLIKRLSYSIIPDMVTLIIFVIIPVVGTLYVFLRFFPRYRANKEIIRKRERGEKP